VAALSALLECRVIMVNQIHQQEKKDNSRKAQVGNQGGIAKKRHRSQTRGGRGAWRKITKLANSFLLKENTMRGPLIRVKAEGFWMPPKLKKSQAVEGKTTESQCEKRA